MVFIAYGQRSNVSIQWSVDNNRDVKSLRPKWPRGQNFGLCLGFGLKALAWASNIWPSAWLRSAAEEPAVKKRLTSLFARDVTKFEFELEFWRISNNFTAFDIRRMLKLPSRRMRI